MTQPYSFFDISDDSTTGREGLQEIRSRRKNCLTSDKPDKKNTAVQSISLQKT